MREGYLVICLVWIVTAVYGALPYVLAGDEQLGRPIDALFEGMSGFTTTGASVVTDVDALPRSILVWRQLTAWLGGIGVVALGLAVLPRLRVGGRQLLESELSTPARTDTISNRIRDTAQPLRRAVPGAHRGRLPRAGAARPGSAPATRWTPSRRSGTRCRRSRPPASPPRRPSLEGFGALTQWTIVAIMILGGTNFLLLHRALVRRRVRDAMRDEELRLYLTILLVAGAVVAAIVWAEAAAERRGGHAGRLLPGHLGGDHDGLLQRRVRQVAAVRADGAGAAVLRGRLRGIHGGLDQDRAPPPAGAPARARGEPHGASRSWCARCG